MENSRRNADVCNKNSQTKDPEVDAPAEVKKPDGGWGWVVMFSSFMMNVLIDGVALNFGLFFKALTEHFNGSTAKTQSLSSILMGTYYLIGPIAGALCNKFGCRNITMAGAFISGMGLFSCTFSPTLDIMVLLYAVVGGIGFGLMMLPAQVAISLYFHRRLSFANAMCRSGSGVGSFVFAPLSVYLLENYGWQGAIWIMSGLCLNGIVFATSYRPIKIEKANDNVKSDIVEEKESIRTSIKSVFDFSLLANPTMWCYGIISLLIFIGMSLPYNFLPAFVTDIGFLASEAALLVSILSIFSTAMRIVISFLGDRSWINYILLHSIVVTIGGAAMCFVPFCQEFGVLAACSAIFGTGMGSFVALKPAILHEVLPLVKLSDIYGVVNAFQGVGVFLSSPIAGLLVDMTGNYSVAFYLSGASFCLAGLLGFPLWMLEKREKRKTSKRDTQATVFHMSDLSKV